MIVKGQIVDNNMKIIPYANISVVGTNIATIANVDGHFTINAPSLNSQLRFDHAAFDYDIISVQDFLKLGYIELFPISIKEVTVYGQAKTPKKDNTLLWILGAALAGTLIYQFAKNQPKKVKL